MIEKGYPAATAVGSSLSRAQIRLWFLRQLRPDDTSYNLVTAVRIEGPLHPRALATAGASVLRDHAGLRSTFQVVDSIPEQRVGDPLGPEMALVDLGALPLRDQRKALAQILATLAGTPIDLELGPIARWTLVRENVQRHVLVFTVHHIVFDGGSLTALSNRLSQVYAAHATGIPAEGGRPAGRTGVVSADSPSATAEAATDRAKAFWLRTLAGAPPTVDVFGPPSTAGTSRRHPAACTVTFTLGPERTAALRRLAAGQRCTPFMALLTIFAGLVSRYTHREDLVIGTPISTRGPQDPQIGLNLNMLPLRLSLSGATGVIDGMQHVRDVVLDSADHLALSFELLVELLAPERNLDVAPIFQIVFAHQAAPPTLDLPRLSTSLLTVDPAAAKYPLTVVATESGDDLEIAVTIDEACADRETAGLFAANFDLMLSGALARPSQAMGSLPVLADIDRIPSGARADFRAPHVRDSSLPSDPGGSVHWPRMPHTAREQQVARIWCATLGLESVDVSSTFFDQGGNSLLLLRMHAAITQAIAPDLALADLFRYPSIEQLAAHLEAENNRTGLQPTGDPLSAGPIDPVQDAAARGVRRRQRTPRRPR